MKKLLKTLSAIHSALKMYNAHVLEAKLTNALHLKSISDFHKSLAKSFHSVFCVE